MKNCMKKVVSFGLIFMMAIILVTGCTPKEEPNANENSPLTSEEKTDIYPMEVEDGFGNKVTIEKQPKRIISLAPSHTEILFALGLDDEIVGVTTYCNYPEEATKRASWRCI